MKNEPPSLFMGAHVLVQPDYRSPSMAFNAGEDERRRMHVRLDMGFHFGTAVEPLAEFLDEPRVQPLVLSDELDLLPVAFAASLPEKIVAAENLELSIVKDCRPELAVHADVFSGPVVQTDRGGRASLVDAADLIREVHHHDAVRVTRVLRPAG